jgi:hypothetical protein
MQCTLFDPIQGKRSSIDTGAEIHWLFDCPSRPGQNTSAERGQSNAANTLLIRPITIEIESKAGPKAADQFGSGLWIFR